MAEHNTPTARLATIERIVGQTQDVLDECTRTIVAKRRTSGLREILRFKAALELLRTQVEVLQATFRDGDERDPKTAAAHLRTLCVILYDGVYTDKDTMLVQQLRAMRLRARAIANAEDKP